MKPAAERYARHVNPALMTLLGVFGYGRVFTRAQDVWLWDDEGRKYLDFLAGFGAVNIGHNHPRLLKRLHEFLESSQINLNHVGPSADAANLAAALTERIPSLERTLFSTSGAEAVEAGIKLARAATGRRHLVYCGNAYHGATLATLSVTDSARMRSPFEPLLADCHQVQFGDIGALENALTRDTAAFLVEPIQCEGGVVLPPAGYLRQARDLCRARGALLVVDEVQTGLGRAGTLLASNAEDVIPDVLVLAKSLGGSIAAIGATLTTREIHDRACGSLAARGRSPKAENRRLNLRDFASVRAGFVHFCRGQLEHFDFHASTFAGNAFAAVAALETLGIIDDEKLVENSAAIGQRLLDGLRSRLSGHPLVRDIRGRGLIVGIELGPADSAWLKDVKDYASRSVFGHWAAVRLLEQGIVCQPATHNPNVLRLEPPLTVKAVEVDRAIQSIANVLGEYRGYAALTKDVTARLGAQFFRGWEFR